MTSRVPPACYIFTLTVSRYSKNVIFLHWLYQDTQKIKSVLHIRADRDGTYHQWVLPNPFHPFQHDWHSCQQPTLCRYSWKCSEELVFPFWWIFYNFCINSIIYQYHKFDQTHKISIDTVEIVVSKNLLKIGELWA